MACRYTYQGKTYEAWEFEDVLKAMPPVDASKFISGVSPTPRLPFGDATDKWLNLALKRIITMAVEGGYDKIAFVNGEQSADRYDLSKQIRQIDAAKMNGDYFMIVATGNNGKTVIEKAIAKDTLPDVLGKDLAEKIVKDGGGTYSGLDLKVGGEGMKAFYDQIVPNAVKALAKKLGGDVSRVEFDPESMEEDAGPTIKQPGLTITPQMREKVEDGLPLFSKRNPGDADFDEWFSGSVVTEQDGSPKVVFRGEHGDISRGRLQTQLGSYTFTDDKEVAEEYARTPNDSRMMAKHPRLLEAYLSLKNPVFHNEDDPFVDFSLLISQFGKEAAAELAIRHADRIEYTANWVEDEEGRYEGLDSVEQLVKEKPELIETLYMDAFPLLDDEQFVALAKRHGYDGAIHVGNGLSHDSVEYRVFDASQVGLRSTTKMYDEKVESEPSSKKSSEKTPKAMEESLPAGKVFYRHGPLGGGHLGLEFFTENKSQAEMYARGDKGVPGRGGEVRAYRLSYSNPIDFVRDPKAREWALKKLEETGEYGWLRGDIERNKMVPHAFEMGYFPFFEEAGILDAAKVAGHDAVIVNEYPRDREPTVALLDRGLAKVESDDDIARSARDAITETPEFKRWSKSAPVVGLGENYTFRSGSPVVVTALHGTTSPDIYAFDGRKGNVEADFGAGFYASNTPEDVAINYANEDGPDLTMKVELLAEKIESDDEFEGGHGDALRAARAKLSGAAPNTMKLYMRFGNPAVIGGKNETVLDYEENFDEETEEYDEPTGKLVEFVDAVREIAPDYYVWQKDIESAVARIFEESGGEGLLVSSAVRIIKNDLIDAQTDDGMAAGPEIARRALESIGFDGIIDTSVSKKFRMDGMNGGTVHFIAFRPEQIKSATGNNGQFDPENPDIRFSRKQATWTDDRIDRLMSKYAYTMDDNRTKAYAAWVRPQDFLDATTPADFKGKLESEKSPLDKDQLMREVQEIQLISRDHPKSGGVFKTEGHEGRHRMMALRDAGVERVPVTLTIPTKNGAEPLTSVFVTAQKWSGGPSAQSGFTVERMIPISWAHHDDLKAEFGGEGGVSFSAKDQTETPEFKKWFGDSKVVDDRGKPLVVYHGTTQSFDAFKDGTGWFTVDPLEANFWGGMNSTGANVVPAYLSIKNPRILQAATASKNSIYDALSLLTPEQDGVLVMESGKIRWAVVAKPEQIKSAIGNNGDFDGSKGDISRSAREDDYPLRQSSREIVGDVGRTYTADQKAAFARVGFEVEQPSLKERAQALWKDAGKKLAQGLFDQFAPVRELSQDAYGLLRLAKGSAGSFETLLKGGKLKLTDGVYDFDETQKGGVIDRLLIPMQGEHHDFLRWIAANRAEGLLAEGRENLFTQDDIDVIKTLQDGRLGFDYTLQHGPRAGSTTRVRAEMYADSLKTFNEFNKNVLDMASQSGLIDEESRHLWEGEFYVPFYRVSEEDGLQGANIKGGVVRQKAFQKLKGGKDVLNADLLDNTLMNWAHLLDASAKNRAAKATLEAAEVAGAAIPASEDIARQIGKATGNRHGVVWFMDSGMQRFYLVEDPYLMSAITSLEYAGMKNPVMNAMSAVKHYLTVGVTASPFFKVRNLIRDSVQAVASAELSYNPGKNLAEGWAASNQKGDMYFRLLAGGGTIHFGTMLEGSEAKRVQALVEAGVNPDNILDNGHKLVAFYKRRIKPAIDAYNELGNRGETINRAALYKQLIAQGKSHAEASLMARDLMDFSMQGNFSTIRFLTQVVPFLNARLQGLHKLGKAARENPQRMALVMGAVAMASLALLALYGDDDDWKKREDWDRDNFWWFKIGGVAYRVPKPFEVGAFGTLAERSAELIFSDEMTGDRFRSRVMALLGDNLSMNPVPQLVKPMLDVYANKDSFSGRPIETMGMDKLQAPYRFTANTSMTARAASTAMNAVTGLVGKESLSPVQVDSLIRGYFGWLGTFIVGGADIVARQATDQPTRPTPDLWKAATGGMVSQLDDAQSRYVSQVYDQARAIEEAYGTWRSLQKEGKTEQAADFKDANIEKIQAYRNVEAIKGAIAKINQRIRDVEASDISRDEKRDEVRRLNQRKDEFSRRLAPV